MLPAKKLLRSIPEKMPSRRLISYCKKADMAKYAVDVTVESCNRKRILCLWWYDTNSSNVEYVSYISKDADILTRTTSKPIRWYTSNINNLYFVENKCYSYNFEFVNVLPIYKFFDENMNISALYIITNKVYKTKEINRVARSKVNAQKKCHISQAYFDELEPIPRGVKQWAKSSVLGYEAYFDIENRHSAHCSKCGKDFVTVHKIKNGNIVSCPHCRAKLKAITRKKRSNSLSKGFQVISKMNNDIVVRHFCITRNLNNDVSSYFFYEYERNLMTPLDAHYAYRYFIKRHNSLANDFYWDNKKPYQGPHIWGTLPNLYYEDEMIYPRNISSVIKGTPYEYCCLDYQHKNYKIRIEDYLAGYMRHPFIEQLYKAGYTYLADDCLYNKLSIVKENASNIPDILGGMPKAWREFVKENKLNCVQTNTLKEYYDSGVTLQDFLLAVEYRNLLSSSYYHYINFEEQLLELYKIYGKEIKVSFRKVIKYLCKNKHTVSLYKDYLRMYGALIKHRWNSTALFPKDLINAHDRAVRMYKENENEMLAQELLNLYNRSFIGIDNTVIGNYQFVFPKTKEDFVTEGLNNNNCVGGYASETVNNDGIVVVFMRLKSDPTHSLVTLEYKINFDRISLIQCYREHNSEATKKEHEIALQFAPQILKNYKMAV